MSKIHEDYVALCEFWANRKSKDPSTKTGAVIVRPNNTIVGMGYNGFPKGIVDDPTLLTDREEKMLRVVHCEMNAIMSAGELVIGCTLYTWPFLSCPRCAVHVIQAGITRVVAPSCPPDKLERWGEALEMSKKLFAEAGIEVIEL